MKLVSARIHGLFDYVLAAILFSAPGLYGFSPAPMALFYIAAILHMGLSLMTHYPLGLVKVLPLTLHANTEAAVAGILLVSPWLFGFAAEAQTRHFFLGTSVLIFAVWSITDYRGSRRRRARKITLREEEGKPSRRMAA